MRLPFLPLLSGLLAAAVHVFGAPARPAPTNADVPYGPEPTQLLDVYLPPNTTTPCPVLVWFGGLWKPAKNVPDLNHFFPQGIAAIAVQTGVMGDASARKIEPPVAVCLLDAVRALQFVRLHAAEWGLDPARIVVGGGSQGALPALYIGTRGELADPAASDPVARISTQVLGVAAYRSQPSIDPRQMQDWVPGVIWGPPALGMSFEESLKKRTELQPLIAQWSPDALLSKDSAPIYFENNWGLTQPSDVTETDYRVHSPRWGLGFQKLAQERGATCYVKYPDHPTDGYDDIWDFIAKRLTAH
jgi:hypothetical protein